MNRNILYIFCLGLVISLLSICYFFGLVLGLPFWATAAIGAVGSFFFCRYVLKNTVTDETREPDRRPLYVLAGGIALITVASAILLRKHGDTDAISNWNFIARYLADQEHWKNLFSNSVTYAHADYPHGYPGATAFFWRLFSTQSEIVPMALSFVATICIPMLIFSEQYKKHLPLATTILLLFALDKYYLNCGLNQYADTLLSFYLLCAIISMQYYERTKDRMYLLLCTAMLGACLWTKNEGMIICGMFALFYMRVFTVKQNLPFAIGGVLPALITFTFFKLIYAPPNDLLAASDKPVFALLTDGSRYSTIVGFMKQSFSGNFIVLTIFSLVYLISNIFRLRRLKKEFYLLVAILAVYFLIYVVSPRGLEWHLVTSLDRLILQLSPSLFLILGNEISNIELPITTEARS